MTDMHPSKTMVHAIILRIFFLIISYRRWVRKRVAICPRASIILGKHLFYSEIFWLSSLSIVRPLGNVINFILFMLRMVSLGFLKFFCGAKLRYLYFISSKNCFNDISHLGKSSSSTDLTIVVSKTEFLGLLAAKEDFSVLIGIISVLSLEMLTISLAN